MCKFSLQGKCTRGKKCQFAHTTDELRNKPDLRWTSLCTSFAAGQCLLTEDKCPYAHGVDKLRAAVLESAAEGNHSKTANLNEEQQWGEEGQLLKAERLHSADQFEDANVLDPEADTPKDHVGKIIMASQANGCSTKPWGRLALLGLPNSNEEYSTDNSASPTIDAALSPCSCDSLATVAGSFLDFDMSQDVTQVVYADGTPLAEEIPLGFDASALARQQCGGYYQYQQLAGSHSNDKHALESEYNAVSLNTASTSFGSTTSFDSNLSIGNGEKLIAAPSTSMLLPAALQPSAEELKQTYLPSHMVFVHYPTALLIFNSTLGKGAATNALREGLVQPTLYED
eukprot:GHVT01011763.1.p1 GENE.GHVT01011763.1~~GHVT01011763.1.p1  ORF type:complete len:342 (-),score=43.68 GHVT01011763.1:3298-4323(-)